jgi:pyrroline-5-carboxylate reductase
MAWRTVTNDSKPLRLGFLGTGAITSAIVNGLAACGVPCRICLSPRNEHVAARLARFPMVRVATSNQAVLDCSDVIFVAVRPDVAAEVLAAVKFRDDHRVVSLVAAISRDDIAALVRPAATVVCAVPLPTVAHHAGPTAIYPPDPVAELLFNRLGVAMPVDNELEFQAIFASTAVIASFFTFLDTLCSWLTRHEVPEARARAYVASMFDGLTGMAERTKVPFAELVHEFATKGGLNEEYRSRLTQAAVFAACSQGLDATLQRIQGRHRGA